MPGNLAEIPLSVVAAWPAPNYEHPRDQRTWLVPVSIVLEVVVTFLVALRFFLRGSKKAGHFGLDDLFIVPAWLFATFFSVLGILGTLYYGLDRHNWDVPFQNFQKLALVSWLAEVTFLLSTTCTKVSVLLFYRRLTSGTEVRRWKWAVWGAIGFTVASNLAFLLTLLGMCQPISGYWRAFDFANLPEYHCTSMPSLNLVAGVFSVTSDLIAVILPVAMLRNFDISKRQRVALNCLFSLGLIVCAVGALRTYWHGKLGYEYDLSYVGYDAFFWSLLEMQLALVCAVAPVLRSFYRIYISKSVSEYAPHNSTNAQTVSTRHLSRPPPSDMDDFEKWGGSRDSASEEHELCSISTKGQTAWELPPVERHTETIELKT